MQYIQPDANANQEFVYVLMVNNKPQYAYHIKVPEEDFHLPSVQ